MAQTSFSGPVASANGFLGGISGGTVTLQSALVADAGDYTPTAGNIMFFSDANTGVGTVAFGDGTDWIDIKTGLAVA